MSFKLSRHAFIRFWDLHAWVGVLSSLVLHLMFVLGCVALFRAEVSVWEEPLAQIPGDSTDSLEQLPQWLSNYAKPFPEDLYIELPRGGHGSLRVGYSGPNGAWTRVWVDAQQQRMVTEREGLMDFLYRLHFLQHELTGSLLYRFSGFLAAALLLTLVTGVLIQLKDLLPQFFQFRASKSQRVLWSDLHKILGVMGLPFQLMYAYTGAFIVLGGLVGASLIDPVFGGDDERAERISRGAVESVVKDPGPVASVLPLTELIALARVAEPRLDPPQFLQLQHHGHANGRATVQGPLKGSVPLRWGEITLAETDGRVVSRDIPEMNVSGESLNQWVFGLHYGLFGGVPLRLMYLLLGLATSATILTGNWIWLERRRSAREAGRARAESITTPILARLTAGVGAGTFVAVAALFLASRCFSLSWASRRGAEHLVFILALVLCIAWAVLSHNTKAIWWQQLALASLLLLPVVPLAARWSSAGLLSEFWGSARGEGQRISAVVGVDWALLAASAVLGGAAWRLRAASAEPVVSALTTSKAQTS